MIPKVIHYCWFGRGAKPELVQRCIESWRKFCPDYEIVEWNEDNFDISCNRWCKEAYESKKWAFVSDMARLAVVHENGGIYLDTDVELKRNLDDLLSYDGWFASGDIRYINTGLGFGGCQGNELLRLLVEERKNREFDMTVCIAIDTPIIRKYLGLKQSRNSQEHKNICIIGMNQYGTYARHHYENSWSSPEDRAFSKQRARYSLLWKTKCLFRNPTIMNFLERNGETRISKLYVFFAYDFLDCGPVYFFKRLLRKIKKGM